MAVLNTEFRNLRERSVLSKQLRLEPAQLTDVGRIRPHNEDNMAYVSPKDPVVMARKGALFIVADGMGGHAAGEVASEIAVDTVSKVYYQDDSDDVLASLTYAIKRANTLIHQRAAENMLRSGMGTTCVAAVLRGSTAYIANVGDSRAYYIHNGQVRQISQDHSWVAEQVRAGLLTEEQARSHAQRNVITRSLGTQPDVEIDVFVQPLEVGDFIVLCSDGLSGLITDEDLLSTVSQYQPQESVYHLVERANENGGPDNITVIVARVQEVGWEPSIPTATMQMSGQGAQEPAEMATMPLPSSGFSIGASRKNENGWVATSPSQFRIPTGPLSTAATISPTLPSQQPKKRKRSRLLYPVLTIFLLLVLVMAASAYYLMQSNTTAAALASAGHLLKQAQGENPTSALKDLSTAQSILRTVHPSALNSSQNTQLQTLQMQLVAITKNAITNYTTQSNITLLPCTGTTRNNTITTSTVGSAGVQVTAVAALMDAKGTALMVALGQDGHLYQIKSDYTLSGSLLTLGGIQKIASDGSRLLALTATPATKPTYSLHLLLPSGNTLQDANAITIDTAVAQQDGSIPSFVTAWGTDVYVVLTSTSAPNNAYILSYTIDGTNKLVAGPVTKISISNPIQSVAAFPNHQLFLLYSDGSVQNWVSGSQASVSVVVQQPIPTPLAVTAQNFTFNTPVPQVSVPSSVFLILPRSILLLAGSVNNTPHLYLVDSMYHRVLDLEIAPTATATATTTPTPRPTATATGAAGAGGGVAASSNQMKMRLDHQYVSASLLSTIQSAVADPRQPSLYLLTQQSGQGGATMQNLLTIDVSQNSICTPE